MLKHLVGAWVSRGATYDFPDGFVANGTPIAVGDHIIVTGNCYVPNGDNTYSFTHGQVYSLEWDNVASSNQSHFNLIWNRVVYGHISGSAALVQGTTAWSDNTYGQCIDSEGKIVFPISTSITPASAGSYMVALSWSTGRHVWGSVDSGDPLVDVIDSSTFLTSYGGLRRLFSDEPSLSVLVDASPTVGNGEVYLPSYGVDSRSLTNGSKIDTWSSSRVYGLSCASMPYEEASSLLFGIGESIHETAYSISTTITDFAGNRGFMYSSANLFDTLYTDFGCATPALFTGGSAGNRAIYSTDSGNIWSVGYAATGFVLGQTVGTPTSCWSRTGVLGTRPILSVPPVIAGVQGSNDCLAFIPYGGGSNPQNPEDGSIKIVHASTGADAGMIGPFTGKGYVIGGMAISGNPGAAGSLYVMTSGTQTDARLWISCYE